MRCKFRELINAQIAQLVEQRTENPRVAGSIPALGILNAEGCLEKTWRLRCEIYGKFNMEH